MINSWDIKIISEKRIKDIETTGEKNLSYWGIKLEKIKILKQQERESSWCSDNKGENS